MDSLQTQPQQESRLHFLDYWRIIRIRKAIIITVFLITAIVATAVTFLLPESYASTARIRIEPDIISDVSSVTAARQPTLPTILILFRLNLKSSRIVWCWEKSLKPLI